MYIHNKNYPFSAQQIRSSLSNYQSKSKFNKNENENKNKNNITPLSKSIFTTKLNNILYILQQYCQQIQEKAYQNITVTYNLMKKYEVVKVFKEQIDSAWEKINIFMRDMVKIDQGIIRAYSGLKAKIRQSQEEFQICQNQQQLNNCLQYIRNTHKIPLYLQHPTSQTYRIIATNQQNLCQNIQAWQKTTKNLQQQINILKDYNLKIIQAILQLQQSNNKNNTNKILQTYKNKDQLQQQKKQITKQYLVMGKQIIQQINNRINKINKINKMSKINKEYKQKQKQKQNSNSINNITNTITNNTISNKNHKKNISQFRNISNIPNNPSQVCPFKYKNIPIQTDGKKLINSKYISSRINNQRTGRTGSPQHLYQYNQIQSVQSVQEVYSVDYIQVSAITQSRYSEGDGMQYGNDGYGRMIDNANNMIQMILGLYKQGQ